jgi:hypothetical protein
MAERAWLMEAKQPCDLQYLKPVFLRIPPSEVALHLIGYRSEAQGFGVLAERVGALTQAGTADVSAPGDRLITTIAGAKEKPGFGRASHLPWREATSP